MKIEKEKNIFGSELEICCSNPITGYFRDGYCHTKNIDRSLHIVCTIMTKEFLLFSQAKGNDLITSNPSYNFPGLKEGDCWCLCATRWLEAYKEGLAPPIKPKATNIKILELISSEELKKYYVQ